ncbi:MAG: hypothetical protein IH946_11805 [Bacteroidetes bacterium]|nr:hypothetical protein [Bacteroidota bacterium]
MKNAMAANTADIIPIDETGDSTNDSSDNGPAVFREEIHDLKLDHLYLFKTEVKTIWFVMMLFVDGTRFQETSS